MNNMLQFFEVGIKYFLSYFISAGPSLFDKDVTVEIIVPWLQTPTREIPDL